MSTVPTAPALPLPSPPPPPPPPARWAFVVGRRTRDRLDLAVLYPAPAAPATCAP